VVITTYSCKGDHWTHSGSLGFTAVSTGNALCKHSELRHTNPSLKSSPSSPRELYTLPAPSEIENTAPSDSDLDAAADHDSDSQSKKWKKIHETRRMLKEKRLRSKVKMLPYDLWVGR
jgi:hypothetical protein